MIVSFSDKDTKRLWEGNCPKKYNAIELQAKRRLNILNAATSLKDLSSNPGNRMHQLTGDLKGYYSISINMQWRIIFKWKDNDATNVEIIDYH